MKIEARRVNDKVLYKGIYKGKIAASNSLFEVISILLS